MKFWKQLLLSVVVLAAAFFAWIRFDPAAPGWLDRAGIALPGPVARFAAEPAAATREAGGPGNGGGRGGNRGALVVTEQAAAGRVNDRFSAIGTGAPVRTVTVRPQVSGIISEVAVGSGAAVERGEVLVRLDSDTEEIAVERARIAVETAEQKVARNENLLAQRTISSVEADTARRELETARLELRQAELDLSQRVIAAPIAGTIGILGVNSGDYVTNQTEIATIDDRERILIEFYVPERLVGSVTVGAPVTAEAVARPGETFTGRITAVDNRLDEASRTLRVRAEIPNVEDRLRAGMSFEVTMRFAGDSYPSVDPLAVQWDSEGSYVWRVADGKAERVGIRIVQRNMDSVLVSGPIGAGDVIVVEGVQNVRAGGAVRVAGAEDEARPQDGEGSARVQPAAGKAGS